MNPSLKCSILPFFLFIISVLQSCSPSTEATNRSGKNSFESLNEVIKERFEIEDRIDGDLNGDLYDDEVYVIRLLKSGERRLLICLGQADNKWEIHTQSEAAILSWDIEKNEIDRFVELQVTDGVLRIVHQEPANPSCLWMNEFQYDAANNVFILTQVIHNLCDSYEIDSESPNVRTAKDFGKVELIDFDIKKMY